MFFLLKKKRMDHLLQKILETINENHYLLTQEYEEIATVLETEDLTSPDKIMLKRKTVDFYKDKIDENWRGFFSCNKSLIEDKEQKNMIVFWLAEPQSFRAFTADNALIKLSFDKISPSFLHEIIQEHRRNLCEIDRLSKELQKRARKIVNEDYSDMEISSLLYSMMNFSIYD